MDSHSENSLLDSEQYKIYEFKENQSAKVPGYLVVSTAKLNVEKEEENSTNDFLDVVNKNFFEDNQQQFQPSAKGMIEKIAKSLIEIQDPEIIINIHGYSLTPSDTEKECQKIYEYVNTSIEQANNHIFIGYRWPAENPFKEDESGSFKEKLSYAVYSLPFLLAGILVVGLTISVWSTLILLFLNILSNSATRFFTILLILSGISSSIVLTLIILRMSNYFRDFYRASNYGVTDLVELLRQLDYAVYKLVPHQRIKLSFISHSMGNFVVTDVIRILSDVFDIKSINKKPSSNIGNVFRLGRLVLVAPDIPVETILLGRANFLRSSLRRCEEAYIFCNEGDLALRFTSTAANYFSFPAKTRISGYRLGNVAVRHFRNKNDRVGYASRYGVINLLQNNSTRDFIIDNPYKYLEIRSSNSEHRNLEEITELLENEVQPADLFTYFDCTDYKENKSDNKGVVSSALQKPAINFWDYILLTLAFIRQSINSNNSQGIDTHGGYFRGSFTQKAIYELAFLGFQGFLKSLSINEQGKEQIEAFSQKCKEKQIQVVIAPQIYKQNSQE